MLSSASDASRDIHVQSDCPHPPLHHYSYACALTYIDENAGIVHYERLNDVERVVV